MTSERGTIDAHFHVWDTAARPHAWLDDLPALRPAYGLAELKDQAIPAGVTAGVLVQVLNDAEESAEFLGLAASDPFVAGVVAWVDLEADDVADELARLADGPGGDRLVSVRHLVESEPDPGFLLRPAVLRGLRAVREAGLCFDLLVRASQLPEAIAMARRLGELSIVLDHGAKPLIASGTSEPWRSQIAELASLEHVSCKLSGLVTEAGDRPEAAAIAPYARHLLECFGPSRLMFGSDWPVCTIAASYREVLDLCAGFIAELSGPERAEVLGATARRIYRLSPQVAG